MIVQIHCTALSFIGKQSVSCWIMIIIHVFMCLNNIFVGQNIMLAYIFISGYDIPSMDIYG